MWYDPWVPEFRPTTEIDAAASAVAYAQLVRRHHRRRTDRGDAQRERDIALALDRIKDAMKPLRSMIGRFPYGPQTTAAEVNREEIYAASALLQVERRKLHKMKAR